jgi:hypothetical protein
MTFGTILAGVIGTVTRSATQPTGVGAAGGLSFERPLLVQLGIAPSFEETHQAIVDSFTGFGRWLGELEWDLMSPHARPDGGLEGEPQGPGGMPIPFDPTVGPEASEAGYTLPPASGWSERTLAGYAQYPHAETIYAKLDEALVDLAPRFPWLEDLPIGPKTLRADPSDPVATLKAAGIPDQDIKITPLQVEAFHLEGNLRVDVVFTRTVENGPFTRMKVTVKDPPNATGGPYGLIEDAKMFVHVDMDLLRGRIDAYGQGRMPLAEAPDDEAFWTIPDRLRGYVGVSDARELLFNTRQGVHEVLQQKGLSLSADGLARIEGDGIYKLEIDQGPSYRMADIDIIRDDNGAGFWVTQDGQVFFTNNFSFRVLRFLSDLSGYVPGPDHSDWSEGVPTDAAGQPLAGALPGPHGLLARPGKVMTWPQITKRLGALKWSRSEEGGTESFRLGGMGGATQMVRRDILGNLSFEVEWHADHMGGMTYRLTHKFGRVGEDYVPGVTTRRAIWEGTGHETVSEKIGFGHVGEPESPFKSSARDWSNLLEDTGGTFHFSSTVDISDYPELAGSPLALEVAKVEGQLGEGRIAVFRGHDTTFLTERKLDDFPEFPPQSMLTIWDEAGEKLGWGYLNKDGKIMWNG